MASPTCSDVLCKLLFMLVCIISVWQFCMVLPSLNHFIISLHLCLLGETRYTNMHRLIHTNKPWHLFIKLPQPTLPCCALSGTRNQHALFRVAFNSQMSSSGLIRPETSACALFLHTITALSSQSAVPGSHTYTIRVSEEAKTWMDENFLPPTVPDVRNTHCS